MTTKTMDTETREADHPVLGVKSHSYQPSKAELEEPITLPPGTTGEDLMQAAVTPVRVVEKQRGLSLAAPVTLSFALLLAFSNQARAQEDWLFDPLFHWCRTVGLVVQDLSDDAAEIGLTVERLQTLAESRLRAARMYDDLPVVHYVYVRVSVVGAAYSIDVQFKRPMWPPEWVRAAVLNSGDALSTLGLRTGIGMRTLIATTWEQGSTGTHGQNAGFILQNVSESLDEFILEYLRVNESACEEPSLP